MIANSGQGSLSVRAFLPCGSMVAGIVCRQVGHHQSATPVESVAFCGLFAPGIASYLTAIAVVTPN